jgi:hypothetical protein
VLLLKVAGVMLLYCFNFDNNNNNNNKSIFPAFYSIS